MGDPKRHRKKYETPSHPWQRSRLEEEAVLKKEYGLKNKKEIWKSRSLLKHFTDIAKRISRLTDEYSKKQASEVLTKLKKYGLLDQNATIKDILGLNVRDFLERRLQTIVYRKGLARSIKQARQFIVHGHISIGDKKITVPSYLVKLEEEDKITFSSNSPLSSEDHPERNPKSQKETSTETKESKEETNESNADEKNKGIEEGKEEKTEEKIEEDKENKK